mgnify:FL=1
MENVTYIDHPLVQHKISLLRDKNTGSKEFRELVQEIAMFMCYEATRDLPLKEVQIETPLGLANSNIISGRKVAFVPIMRAGLGMMDGALALVPAAKVGHIGLYRDEANGNAPQEYYCKLPFDIANREVIILDPMLATGGSAVKAVDIVKKAGAKQIKFMCIITCPEGLKAFQTAHPDVDIICGAVDKGLNENSYIVPGIGDCGDRLFGTK